MGFPVRYNGKEFLPESEIIQTWLKEGRLIGYCPEVEGGLGVPRAAAEIFGGHGRDVMGQKAKVLTQLGEDLTEAYMNGADKAVRTVQENSIQMAVLKSNSPACGIGAIYDGTFSGVLRSGDGVAAAALKSKGIKIFDENHLLEANHYLNQIESIQ